MLYKSVYHQTYFHFICGNHGQQSWKNVWCERFLFDCEFHASNNKNTLCCEASDSKHSKVNFTISRCTRSNRNNNTATIQQLVVDVQCLHDHFCVENNAINKSKKNHRNFNDGFLSQRIFHALQYGNSCSHKRIAFECEWSVGQELRATQSFLHGVVVLNRLNAFD